MRNLICGVITGIAVKIFFEFWRVIAILNFGAFWPLWVKIAHMGKNLKKMTCAAGKKFLRVLFVTKKGAAGKKFLHVLL